MKKLLALVLALGAAVLALAGPAGAHVTVSSADATQGGYGVITFRVPTESETASTTKVSVALPKDTPLAFVSIQPVTDWTAVTKTAKLSTPIKTDDGAVNSAVSQVTWTASSSGAIKPGEFQQFNLEVGPLPKRTSMSFPAIQTYSDGSVVRWIEKQAPGSSTEPEHPAPTLELAAADSEQSASPSASSSSSAAPTVAAKPAASTSNTGPVVLSIVALVVAAAALGLAFVGRARRNSA